MKAFDRVLSTFGILLLLSFRADAHDPSMAHHEWYNKQVMSPATQLRLGVPWKSCCDNGDVFKTRFRVGEDRSDQWQYLKDGEWTVCPRSSSIRAQGMSSASLCRRVACDALEALFRALRMALSVAIEERDSEVRPTALALAAVIEELTGFERISPSTSGELATWRR
jgi:hypothetical protein